MTKYAFTSHQFNNVLEATIGMFLEYRDQHGKEEPEAQLCAIREISEGLDAEMEMFDNGEITSLRLQSIL